MAKRERHIVGMGGGGFSMENGISLLDEYVLSLSAKARPKLCFLPTASGDAPLYIEKFVKAFPKRRAQASYLTLFKRQVKDIRAFLLSQDIIYVGGGNTANMLAVWRTHGVDAVLRECWEKGVVLAGISAGMLCWFESSCTDSFGGVAPLNDGLGFLKGSACPHYDGEKQRRSTYHRLVRKGLAAGYAADDFAALHFVGQTLLRVVSSKPKAAAYRVEVKGGKVIETRLETLQLRV